MKVPPFLKTGDTIGIVCPAAYMSKDKIAACVSTLKKWGYKVKVGKTVGGKSANYFSGTDEERLNDLQSMLDDKNIKAIIFGRGGYGTSRILDQINFKSFISKPKWIVGFSERVNIFSPLSWLKAPHIGPCTDEILIFFCM